MIDGWVIVAFAFLYIGALFCIAYWGDRAGNTGAGARARPYVYALGLAVYCTSWTFFGSVGSAAVKGFDFIAVYLGPIAAFTLGAPLLRRIILIAKAQNITSIADFIAARYGKSPAVAAIVTLVAIMGTLPYIALQLKAVSESVALLIGHPSSDANAVTQLPIGNMDLAITLVLAAFAILFGTRHSDATEHQRGLMLAIAVESAVKLAAFIAVGCFIVFGLFGGFGRLFGAAMANPQIAHMLDTGVHGGTLITVSSLSFVCVFLLPRQFHVTFVENVSEDELKTATRLFPLYLIAINVFVVPVAVAGSLTFRGGGIPHDMYLLALPFQAGNTTFTFLAFLGGLSAATAMVVMETVALSIMVCNDLAIPLIIKLRSTRSADRDMSDLLLQFRRAAILTISLLAYLLYDTIENASLSEIGLLSFAAIAQLAPAFFGGLFWRRASARGAIAGILAGFAVWGYTLLLPALIGNTDFGAALMKSGPFGIAPLKPTMLLYLNFDQFTHGVVLSFLCNIAAYVAVSLWRPLEPIERLQTNIFIEKGRGNPAAPAFTPWRTSVPMDDLVSTVSRYLGEERTARAFAEYFESRGLAPDARAAGDLHAVKFTENLLASAIGAPSSRLVMSLLLRRLNVGKQSALRLLDEASEAVQYNRDLLQSALDHVGQGLAVFDKKMQLICWNRQFAELLQLPLQLVRFGTPLDEIVRHLAQRVHSNRTSIEEFVTDRITKYQVTRETFQERVIDGLVIEVRVNAMPQSGVVVTYTDITERVGAAEALARANETLERRVAERTQELAIAKAKADEANIGKTRFLAAASHDVLQPLNAARLYATSLLERAQGGEFARLAKNIDASLDAVEEILNALLDISRLDSGAMKPEFSVFCIKELLDQLQIDFEPIAKARGVSLKIVPSNALVRSDRKLLRRILQNLVSNALKYNKASGRVMLGCRRRGRNVVIQVHDTGYGIPEHQRAIIFKEFQRLDQYGNFAPGLGLGLSIVERMCRVMDHGLALDSKVGKGSTFAVSVPSARRADLERPRPASRPTPYRHLQGALVLCLDNDRAIIDGMRTLLAGWHCPAITAVGSAEAIEKLSGAKLAPDLIVSDFHLDRENGLEAVAAICAACRADIPSIITSADGAPEVRAAVLAAGAAFLPKPIKPAALRALMAQMLVSQRAAE